MDGQKKKKKKQQHSTCKEETHRESNDPAFIPMDVWAEILMRIPAEDLVKLKIVCKCWYQLITSQSFARSHLDHWTTTSRPPFSGFAVHTYCDIDGWSNSSILHFTVHLDRQEEAKFQCRDFLIKCCNLLSVDIWLLASCDGLLLIGYAKEDHCQLVICNPITGSYRTLPIFQPSSYSRYIWLFSDNISYYYEWAMVRNASSGQYKVFGMQTRPNPRRTCHVFELQGDGHEEKPRNNWKALDVPLPEEWMLESSTTTEGRVHWFAWEAEDEPFKVKILSIDIMTNELWASASVELLPETDLCFMRHGTFYCTQRWNHGLGVWALENFDNPRWVEKSRIDRHYSPGCLTRSTEPFVMPGGVKLVINNNSSSCDTDVMLGAATDTGSSICLICWNAKKVVPHVNSLIGFS